METVVHLEGVIEEGQHAGLSAFYTSDYHYDVFVTKEGEAHFVCLRKRVADIDVIVARHPIDYRGTVCLKIESDAERYTFFYEQDGAFVELGSGKTALLCTEATHPTTFTGVYWGIFSERGKISATHFAVRELK